MSWTNPEKAAAAMARRSLGWERPQYELLLRNIAGIRPECGKISSTNFSATHEGFVRFMAFCERQGFIDAKNDPGGGGGFWCARAQLQCPRMHHKIQQLAVAGTAAGILYGPDALAAFIERQTAQRPPEVGGVTRDLATCDWEWSYKILEGLKAWLFREAKRRNIKLDLDVVPTPSSAFRSTTETQSNGGLQNAD